MKHGGVMRIWSMVALLLMGGTIFGGDLEDAIDEADTSKALAEEGSSASADEKSEAEISEASYDSTYSANSGDLTPGEIAICANENASIEAYFVTAQGFWALGQSYVTGWNYANDHYELAEAFVLGIPPAPHQSNSLAIYHYESAAYWYDAAVEDGFATAFDRWVECQEDWDALDQYVTDAVDDPCCLECYNEDEECTCQL